MSGGLDWRTLMRRAGAELGLAGPAFWALTPFELGSALGLDRESRACGRDDLAALLRRFPDPGSENDVDR